MALAACLLIAMPARAATVAAEEPQDPHDFVHVVFSAAPGEQNRVTVTRMMGGFRIVDDAAILEVRAPCATVSEHETLCPGQYVTATLGDGDDTFVATRAYVLGGDGNDVLTAGGNLNGGAGDDLLVGGARGDQLDGGGGADTLRGGGGDDFLQDGDDAAHGVDSDVLAGGPGSDIAGVSARAGPVAVDLRQQVGQGQLGEGDTLVGVENVNAGGPAVRLTGDSRPNRLYAFGGRTVLSGHGGDDELTAASRTRDALSGGRGDDTLELVPGLRGNQPDVISCGPGQDWVADPMPLQFVPKGCETVIFDEETRYVPHNEVHSAAAPLARVTAGFCSARRVHRCRVLFGARDPGGKVGARGPLLARRAVLIRPGAYGRPVELMLTARGRTALERHRALRVRIGELREDVLHKSFITQLRLRPQP